MTTLKDTIARIDAQDIFLITAGGDGNDQRIAFGYENAAKAAVECLWCGDGWEEDEFVASVHAAICDPDSEEWQDDTGNGVHWAFEDGYLSVQNITNAVNAAAPLISKALAQGDVGELREALQNYLYAQRRMLEKWADGDDAVKAEVWQKLHACEEPAEAALASTPDAGTGWRQVQGPVLDELREHSRLLSQLGRELQDSHYVTAETIYAVHSALGWDDATPTQEQEG